MMDDPAKVHKVLFGKKVVKQVSLCGICEKNGSCLVAGKFFGKCPDISLGDTNPLGLSEWTIATDGIHPFVT